MHWSFIWAIFVCTEIAVANVVQLSSKTFDAEIAKSTWLVAFTAKWCGHCKRLYPELATVIDALKDSSNDVFDTQIQVGTVDAEDRSLLDRFGVVAFPSILLFKKGRETPIRYPPHFDRNSESILRFISRVGSDPLPTFHSYDQLVERVAEPRSLGPMHSTRMMMVESSDKKLAHRGRFFRVPPGETSLFVLTGGPAEREAMQSILADVAPQLVANTHFAVVEAPEKVFPPGLLRLDAPLADMPQAGIPPALLPADRQKAEQCAAGMAVCLLSLEARPPPGEDSAGQGYIFAVTGVLPAEDVQEPSHDSVVDFVVWHRLAVGVELDFANFFAVKAVDGRPVLVLVSDPDVDTFEAEMIEYLRLGRRFLPFFKLCWINFNTWKKILSDDVGLEGPLPFLMAYEGGGRTRRVWASPEFTLPRLEERVAAILDGTWKPVSPRVRGLHGLLQRINEAGGEMIEWAGKSYARTAVFYAGMLGSMLGMLLFTYWIAVKIADFTEPMEERLAEVIGAKKREGSESAAPSICREEIQKVAEEAVKSAETKMSESKTQSGVSKRIPVVDGGANDVD